MANRMNNPIEKLIEVMQTDLQLHRDLTQILQQKLDAMRQRDLELLDALATREQQSMENLAANAVRRTSAIRDAMKLYMPARTGRLATARELARVVGGAFQSRILAMVSLLMEATGDVQRLNRINQIASKKILGHVDHIFQIIAKAGKDIGLYGRAGKKTLLEQNRLVDAIA